MLNPSDPIAKLGYSNELQSLNHRLTAELSASHVSLRPMETLSYAYVEMLQELSSIASLADSVLELTERNKYLEAITLCRKILERALHFRASNNYELAVNYVIAPNSHTAEHLLVSNSDIYSRHDCAGIKYPDGQVCLKFSIKPDTKNRYPMARYIQMRNRDALGHQFPKEYRQLLWSFVDESDIVFDNKWMASHYTSFTALLENLQQSLVMSHSDVAKLKSHYGFLSAVAHAPTGLVNEVHGHNGTAGNYYGPSFRLINLYVAACLLVLMETVVPWMESYPLWSDSRLETFKAHLVHRKIILEELGFPFAGEHEFDSWRASLPHKAQARIESIDMDLSNEYLDSNYLSRIADINRQQFEISVNEGWEPKDLFGISTEGHRK